MKEELILEIKKIEREKLKKSKKREDHIKLLNEIPQGTDVDLLQHLVAKIKEEDVTFFYKTWICDTRGIGMPTVQNSQYEEIDISTFEETELEKLLEEIKKSNDVI